MIEIGTVNKKLDGGKILVVFSHLDTEAECAVLQNTTGDNNTFSLPSIGTQVVCYIGEGNNIALGAVFSDSEPVPDDADPDGLSYQYGKMSFIISDDKASLKNDKNDIKTILKDILNAIKNLTVSTAQGASGTPLPPTITAIEQLNKDIDNLFK